MFLHNLITLAILSEIRMKLFIYDGDCFRLDDKSHGRGSMSSDPKLPLKVTQTPWKNMAMETHVHVSQGNFDFLVLHFCPLTVRFIYCPQWPPAEEARINEFRTPCHSAVGGAVMSIMLRRSQ
jgi:hypothetical protein